MGKSIWDTKSQTPNARFGRFVEGGIAGAGKAIGSFLSGVLPESGPQPEKWDTVPQEDYLKAIKALKGNKYKTDAEAKEAIRMYLMGNGYHIPKDFDVSSGANVWQPSGADLSQDAKDRLYNSTAATSASLGTGAASGTSSTTNQAKPETKLTTLSPMKAEKELDAVGGDMDAVLKKYGGNVKFTWDGQEISPEEALNNWKQSRTRQSFLGNSQVAS
jgi:hypothetical protein